MSKEFFANKRSWSKYKDLILDYYLPPYLAKVAHLKRPILLVDGFSGPGKFGNGEPGSPLIICNAAAGKIAKGMDISVLCCEKNPQLATLLSQNLEEHSFVEIQNKPFSSIVDHLSPLCQFKTTFLYLDPFTPREIVFNKVAHIYSTIKVNGASVEVLLNFNLPCLLRWALAVVKRGELLSKLDSEIEDNEQIDGMYDASVESEELSSIFGGDYWVEIASQDAPFAVMLSQLIQGYTNSLKKYFAEVTAYPIKAKISHTIPKYYMVFGSRHPDALELMNDATTNARKAFASESQAGQLVLFEHRSEELVPNTDRLNEIVLDTVKDFQTRKEHTLRIIRNNFSYYSSSTIRKYISKMLVSGLIRSKSGKVRVNDSELIGPI